MNEIKLKPISELLGMTFFIPSYQRGYRWDKQQIEDLLNDIYAFASKKHKLENEFYCLQPIVVRKLINDEVKKINVQSKLDNKEWYEIIDGQQRLTTIRILISYLAKDLYLGKTLYDAHKKHLFEIIYETRLDSNLFLDNIDVSKSNDFIDYHFISTANDVIKEWFNSPKIKDPQQAKETIRNTLLYGIDNQKQEGVVQIIWYEINDAANKPIDTFIRINMGKIPLTNAELIKALFLQKRNFGTNDVAMLRQIEIANEWDKMEYALQDEDFWWFLNRGQNDTPARIEFLFNFIYELKQKEEKDEKKFDNQFGTDEHKIFRYFNSFFADKDVTYDMLKEEWNKIKDYFYAFEEWFNKPIWYHYIGFLIYCKVSVIDIYTTYQNKKKSEFTEALINDIKKQFKIKCEKDNTNFYIPLSYDKSETEKIRQLLLLFNVEFIVKQYNEIITKNNGNEKDVFIYKFPFKIFKNEKWDIEHIDSFTTNPIKDKDTAIEWLRMANEDLRNEISTELMEKIELFKNNKIEFKTFESLREEIIKIAGEDNNDKEIKNSIGNLTLLNASTNRSYGNSLFTTKRRIIIKEDMDGKFIPICTKHVFLKYFDENGTSRTKWTIDDIKNYQSHIGKVLEGFLDFKRSDNEEI